MEQLLQALEASVDVQAGSSGGGGGESYLVEWSCIALEGLVEGAAGGDRARAATALFAAIEHPDADAFVAAIHEHKPDILGMSALLTTTMPYMKVVVDTLGEEGLRDQVYVMVGGAPVTENFAREVGADAYGRDAAVSVEIAKAHMARVNARSESVTAS